MNILAITAYYPPFHAGGYELRVKNILDKLSARGHKIQVLTNIPEKYSKSDNQPLSYRVIRKLHNPLKAKFFPLEVFHDLQDTKLLENQIHRFKPDVLYLGHMYVLSKALMPLIAGKNIPVVYDEGGSGLIEAWTEHGRWFRFTGDYRSRFAILNWIKPLVIKAVCKLSRGRMKPQWAWPENMRFLFNSELNRGNALARGVPVAGASVIHSGVDTGKFSFVPRTQWHPPLKIIVPGRIERRKGQLDAVRLLERLTREGVDARLVLAGAKWVDGYDVEVVDEIQKFKLVEKITLLSMLSAEDLVKQYQEADICFFPSYFRTGFSRVPLEAMSCGSILISYGNEGSDEVVRDHHNGFIVGAGDFSGILEIIKKMMVTPDLVKKITKAARMDIEENNSLQKYVACVEDLIRVYIERKS